MTILPHDKHEQNSRVELTILIANADNTTLAVAACGDMLSALLGIRSNPKLGKACTCISV